MRRKTMCYKPVIIRNPDYVRQSETFSSYFLGGRVVHAMVAPHLPLFVPPRLPSCRSMKSEMLDDYFAVKPTGEVIPLFMEVACGKCLDCRNKYANGLRSRIILEQSCHDCLPFFVTLTYNDANLPSCGVVKEHVQTFIRALHDKLRHAGYPHEFRHVFFSEYGSQRGRPHYHGLIFGLDPRQFKDYLDISDLIADVWNKGFVKVELVRSLSCFKYVSKYVLKDSVCPIPGGSNPNFWVSSRRNGGIGSLVLDRLSDETLKIEYPYITVKVLGEVRRVFMPQSIRRKLSPCFSEFIGANWIKKFKRFSVLCKWLNHYISLTDGSETFMMISGLDRDGLYKQFRSIARKFKWVAPRYRVFGYAPVCDDSPNEDWLSTVADPSNIMSVYHEFNYLKLTLERFEMTDEQFLQFLTRKSEFNDLMYNFIVNYLKTIEIYDASKEQYDIFISKRMFGQRVKDLQ